MLTENTINQLYEELDILESRISQLESNNTQRGGYFKSILEQVEKPKCCDPCGCSDDENPPQPIDCEGAISYLPLSGQGAELSLLFIVNDEVAGRIDGGLWITGINEILSPYGLSFIDNVGIVNHSDQLVRVKVIGGSFDEVTNEILGYYSFWTLLSLDNPTVTVKQVTAPDYDIPESVEPEIYNEDTHEPMYVEVSACLAPSNSTVSCDGATDNVGFTIAFPLTDDFSQFTYDPLGYVEVIDFKVDGVNVPTNSLPFAVDVVPLRDGNDGGHEWVNGARVSLINESAWNKRIQFSRPQGLYFDWDSNPTILWDEDTNLITCCLAHFVPTPIQISCDGAIDSARFSSSGGRGLNSGYNLVINNELYRLFDWNESTETEPYLKAAIDRLVPDLLEVVLSGSGFGTDWVIKNKTQENLRVNLHPWVSLTDFAIHQDNTNPTLISTSANAFQFCLAPQPSLPIGCEGATNTCITAGFERVWQLVVNDQVLSNDVWGMGGESSLISLLANVGIVLTISYGRAEFKNTTNEYKTVKFNAEVYIGPNAENPNPTLHAEYTDNTWTAFCLAPQPPFAFTCTPEEVQQSVQLFKARDSLPFLTFANVAFNIYESGIQIGSQLSLLDSTAMEGIGLEVVANDGTNRLITISSMDGVNDRAIQLEPTMAIMNDVDITQGNVVKHDGSFFMCLAKKPV